MQVQMYFATFGRYENEGKLFLILQRLFFNRNAPFTPYIQTRLSKISNIECHYSNNIPVRYRHQHFFAFTLSCNFKWNCFEY